ncbi:MAG: hypothetical protein F7B20_01830 [Aeropyrum sp.]|nr:hypothetical protein [Aeropyrum sp.]
MAGMYSLSLRAVLRDPSLASKALETVYSALSDYGCSPGFKAPSWLVVSCRGDSLVRAGIRLRTSIPSASLEPGEVIVDVSSPNPGRAVEIAETLYLSLRGEGLPVELA